MSLHINIMYNYIVFIQHNAIIMINNDLCSDIAHEWYCNVNDSDGYPFLIIIILFYFTTEVSVSILYLLCLLMWCDDCILQCC